MTQQKRLDFLLEYLLKEHPAEDIQIPNDYTQKGLLLRSLVNIRPSKAVPDEFRAVQDEFLQEEARAKGIVKLEDIRHCPSDERLYLWQGDITRIAVDAIVNAAIVSFWVASFLATAASTMPSIRQLECSFDKTALTSCSSRNMQNRLVSQKLRLHITYPANM